MGRETVEAARLALEGAAWAVAASGDTLIVSPPPSDLPAVRLALLSRQPGWITAVAPLVEEDSPDLTDDLLRRFLALSEVSGLVRPVRTSEGLWLRGDVPDPAQAPMLAAHLFRAVQGLLRGDLAGAFAVQGGDTTSFDVEAVLGATRFHAVPLPALEGWQILDPARPEGRPLLVRGTPQQTALVLLLGIHEAPEAQLPPHFVEVLLQVNDHLQAGRLVVIGGLGLMVQVVVPIPVSPARLEDWLAQTFADGQQAVISLAPAQDDLASRLQLLRAWLDARVQEGRLTEVQIALALRAQVRGEPLPIVGAEALFPRVIAEVVQLLFEELPTHSPHARMLMGIGIENAATRGRALDELWEVALDTLASR